MTAISRLERFDGSPADPSLASAFVPSGAASLDARDKVISRLPDVLQVVTEAEADVIQALADPAGVADVFPYGFVVRNPSDPYSRTLAASPAAGQFDGVVTFAFKVPLQASPSEDPFTVSVVFLAVDDDEVKLTQSVEEQTPAGGWRSMPGPPRSGPRCSRCAARGRRTRPVINQPRISKGGHHGKADEPQ